MYVKGASGNFGSDERGFSIVIRIVDIDFYLLLLFGKPLSPELRTSG